jgi:hypothetical protein
MLDVVAHVFVDAADPGRISTDRMRMAGIWNEERLLSGKDDMKSRILAAVEEVTKKFVVDWSSANPGNAPEKAP